MRSIKFNWPRLRKTRIEKNYGQLELQRAIGMVWNSYNRVEKKGVMDMGYFRRACEVLKLTDDQINYIKEL